MYTSVRSQLERTLPPSELFKKERSKNKTTTLTHTHSPIAATPLPNISTGRQQANSTLKMKFLLSVFNHFLY